MFGVAVLSSILAAHGENSTAAAFVTGAARALWAGAGAVALGALAAVLLPRTKPRG